MKKAKLIRFAHRWIGLLFSLVALTASSSGLIHLWMSHTQAPPPTTHRQAAPLTMAEVSVTPSQAADKAIQSSDAKAVSHMQLRRINDQPWYQIFLLGENRPHYVNAATGALDPHGDLMYAQEIARTALGTASCRMTNYLTEYDREYIAIFRILPVYRFDSGDELGTRVYVSTVTGSVTRSTDHQKQWEANVFSIFHKWMFLRDKNLRNYSLGIATLGITLTSLLGIWLFWITRKKAR